MANLIAQHRFYYASNRTTDCSVNTFHFSADDELPIVSAANVVVARIKEFFSENHSGANSSVGARLTAWRRTLPFSSEIRVYDMADPTPRVPLVVEAYDPPGGGGAVPSLPTEVAVCLSYVAQRQSGVPVGRSRGRLYIGPFKRDALDGGTNVLAPQVNSGAMLALADAGNTLKEYGDDPEEPVVWCLYSSTDNSMRRIIGGWVDNEFDTMRSRGIAYTNRLEWPIVSP